MQICHVGAQFWLTCAVTLKPPTPACVTAPWTWNKSLKWNKICKIIAIVIAILPEQSPPAQSEEVILISLKALG